MKPLRVVIAAVCAAAGVAGAPGAASAQDDAIARCRAMPSDAERIACLEAALSAGGGQARERGGIRIPIPFLGGGDDDGDDAVSAAPAASAPQDDSLGAEQVAIRSGTFDDDNDADGSADNVRRAQAQIVDIANDARGMLVMALDNGQVWRQTERVNFPVRIDMDVDQPVQINQSSFGGYRMELFTPDRELKVERLQ